MKKCREVLWVLLVVVFVTACDDTAPTEPNVQLDEARGPECVMINGVLHCY